MSGPFTASYAGMGPEYGETRGAVLNAGDVFAVVATLDGATSLAALLAQADQLRVSLGGATGDHVCGVIANHVAVALGGTTNTYTFQWPALPWPSAIVAKVVAVNASAGLTTLVNAAAVLAATYAKISPDPDYAKVSIAMAVARSLGGDVNQAAFPLPAAAGLARAS